MAVSKELVLVPIKHLRTMNPYVQNAIADWQNKCKLQSLSPLQSAPNTHIGLAHGGSEGIAGTSSFGMSGINAHALIKYDIQSASMPANAIEVSSLHDDVQSLLVDEFAYRNHDLNLDTRCEAYIYTFYDILQMLCRHFY